MLFLLVGVIFGMSEEVLVFVLIMILLALVLGYDFIIGIVVFFVGAGLGFVGVFINLFMIGVV